MPETLIDGWFGSLRKALEAASRISERPSVGPAQLPTTSRGVITANGVKDLIRGFPDAVRYLNSRRSKPFASVSSEADVQDLLYLILKPSIPSLQFETPTRSSSASYAIGDFWVDELAMVVEAKYISPTTDVKRTASEIAEDIWKYSSTTDCEHIVFFVYDPQLRIVDRQQFIAGSSADKGSLTIHGRSVEVEVVLVPS